MSIFIYVFENKNDASELIFFAIFSNYKAKKMCNDLVLMFFCLKVYMI